VEICFLQALQLCECCADPHACVWQCRLRHAHPHASPSPPHTVHSQHLADVLGGAIDLSDLCVARAKLAWVLHLTVVVLNHDGNL
jgi:hypothetical protein